MTPIFLIKIWQVRVLTIAKQDKMILVDFGLNRHDKIIMNDTEPDC